MFNQIKNIIFHFFMKFKKSKECSRAIGYGNFNNVKLVSVYDGDTIKINIENLHPLIGEKISIRINGIDTPEMKGGCDMSRALARQAKQVVQDVLVNAENIDLINCQRGKYFRIVADVYADNMSIANLLIVKGLAVPYDGSTKTYDWCK